MITMYGYIPAWGLPDVSPYVSKTDLLLRLSDIPHKLVELHQGDLTKTPKGKLPYIDDDGTIVSDTVLIHHYLRDKYGDKLDADLTPEQRAVSVAFEKMLDHAFYWALVQSRYRRDEDFTIYDPIWVRFLAWLPEEQRVGPVKDFRERILGQFYHSGMGRNTEEEVEQITFEQFDAISDYLGDKPYFHGDQPTSVDAALYANLTHAMFVPFPSPICTYGNTKPNLLAYVNRIQQEHYMEFDSERCVRGPS
jgi:glutathione S-transferase